jgi:hypothetical protein
MMGFIHVCNLAPYFIGMEIKFRKQLPLFVLYLMVNHKPRIKEISLNIIKPLFQPGYKQFYILIKLLPFLPVCLLLEECSPDAVFKVFFHVDSSTKLFSYKVPRTAASIVILLMSLPLNSPPLLPTW